MKEHECKEDVDGNCYECGKYMLPMKQYITEKQWDEIDEGDRILWIKQFCIQTRAGVIPCSDDFKKELYPTIGQMIRFLGDDLKAIHKCSVGENKMFLIETTEQFTEKELADTLWEAVKYKLKL